MNQKMIVSIVAMLLWSFCFSVLVTFGMPTNTNCEIPEFGPWPACATGEGQSNAAHSADCVIPPSGPWPPCATGNNQPSHSSQPNTNGCVIPEAGPWPPCATGGGNASQSSTPANDDCVIPEAGPWPACATGGGNASPPPSTPVYCPIPKPGCTTDDLPGETISSTPSDSGNVSQNNTLYLPVPPNTTYEGAAISSIKVDGEVVVDQIIDTYRSQLSGEEIVAFYERELPAIGFEGAFPEPETFETTIRTYQVYRTTFTNETLGTYLQFRLSSYSGTWSMEIQYRDLQTDKPIEPPRPMPEPLPSSSELDWPMPDTVTITDESEFGVDFVGTESPEAYQTYFNTVWPAAGIEGKIIQGEFWDMVIYGGDFTMPDGRVLTINLISHGTGGTDGTIAIDAITIP